MVLQSGLSILSFVAFFPLTSALMQNFSNSGLKQYFSLLLSGDSLLPTYWQELTLSIVEVLPILSITLFLTVGIVFIYSLNRAVKNGKQFYSFKITA
jgi:hypothetical protein